MDFTGREVRMPADFVHALCSWQLSKPETVVVLVAVALRQGHVVQARSLAAPRLCRAHVHRGV